MLHCKLYHRVQDRFRLSNLLIKRVAVAHHCQLSRRHVTLWYGGQIGVAGTSVVLSIETEVCRSLQRPRDLLVW